MVDEERGASRCHDERKVIIHVKGARKAAIEQIAKVIESFRPKREGPEFIAPHFAIFNKMYNEKPLNDQSNRNNFVGSPVAHAKCMGHDAGAGFELPTQFRLQLQIHIADILSHWNWTTIDQFLAIRVFVRLGSMHFNSPWLRLTSNETCLH